MITIKKRIFELYKGLGEKYTMMDKKCFPRSKDRRVVI